MYHIDASKERLQAVEILTVPGLFTIHRVDRATLPPWMHLYEMQTAPNDWSQPCLLGRHITVEHFGTVLTASPLPLPPNGYLDLTPGDFDDRHGEEYLTAWEFEPSIWTRTTSRLRPCARNNGGTAGQGWCSR